MIQPRLQAIDPDLGEQLSALMDGELDAERSRFLLRRLESDPALRAAWERWQLVSGSLKGRLALQVDAGFLARVRDGIEQGRHADEVAGAEALAAEATSRRASARTAPGWLRWAAGGAIAASVAVVALVATQPQPPMAIPGEALVEAVPAEPYVIAPSSLSEADLRPRLRAPAQAVSVQQRGPLLQAHGGMQAPDPRVPDYLILHDGRLQQVGLGAFMPYVEAAEGRQPPAPESATR
jgi:sigma-E factor negative regulatory protein RseA